jgi:hypothetical protein
MKFGWFLLVLLISQAGIAQLKLNGSLKKTWSGVDTNQIRAHIAYLASDELLGRAPGSEGFTAATEYVVNEFVKMGVKPAGDAGTYLQKFTLRRSSLTAGSVRLIIKDGAGNIDSINRTDLIVSANPIKPEVNISDAPMIFAGYGVDLPGIHNDYADIDVNGKIVVVLGEVPKGMSSVYATHFNGVGYKIGLAKSKGAVGIIIASPNGSRVYQAEGANPLATFPVTAINTAVNMEKTQAMGTRYVGNVDVYINASNNFVRGLFMNTGKNFDDVLKSLRSGKTQSFDLSRKLSISFKSNYKDVETNNIVGLIPGSDPILKNEYVVHTAHLDHVGVGRPVNGDSIYNGAHDNASGVASLLEIARIYMKGKAKQKRSVLITIVSGEESGLIGSSYFATHPTVPKEKIVANINTDMPTVIAPLLSIVPLGALHSTMMKHVQFAANTMGLTIEEDREPNENFFIRSDQYSFVREHIPAVNCKYGAKTNIPGFDLDKYIKEWRAKYYHKPADQLDGGIFNFTAAKTYVQLNFLISYSVSMDKERPKWNDGELF